MQDKAQIAMKRQVVASDFQCTRPECVRPECVRRENNLFQMPPTSDGKESIRTVACSLEKLIPDASHLDKIRHAVAVTHKATILASELLNVALHDGDVLYSSSCPERVNSSSLKKMCVCVSVRYFW